MVAAGAFGDYHSSEIKFVFGGPKLSGVGEESLSRDFMRYWLGFGRSGGDPNAPLPGHPSGGRLAWPPYDPEADGGASVLDFNSTRQVLPAGFQDKLCRFWDGYRLAAEDGE